MDGNAKKAGQPSDNNADMALRDIEKNMDDFLRKVDKAIMVVNQKVGEDFVRDARQVNTYRDRTANLRNSVGYAIVRDGSMAQENFPGGGVGAAEGRKAANEALLGVDENALAMVAGMNYGVYVEAKGYDVISNSVEKAKVTHQRMMKHVLSKITQ